KESPARLPDGERKVAGGVPCPVAGGTIETDRPVSRPAPGTRSREARGTREVRGAGAQGRDLDRGLRPPRREARQTRCSRSHEREGRWTPAPRESVARPSGGRRRGRGPPAPGPRPGTYARSEPHSPEEKLPRPPDRGALRDGQQLGGGRRMAPSAPPFLGLPTRAAQARGLLRRTDHLHRPLGAGHPRPRRRRPPT